MDKYFTKPTASSTSPSINPVDVSSPQISPTPSAISEGISTITPNTPKVSI
jgi:Ni,Fe-hydrogenase III small subunit